MDWNRRMKVEMDDAEGDAVLAAPRFCQRVGHGAGGLADPRHHGSRCRIVAAAPRAAVQAAAVLFSLRAARFDRR